MVFHVPGLNGEVKSGFGIRSEPYYFEAREFQRYLITNGKSLERVFKRSYPLNSTSRIKIGERLAQLMENKWTYLLVTNNCQSFVEELIGLASTQKDPTFFDCPGADFKVPEFQRKVRESGWYKFVNHLMAI